MTTLTEIAPAAERMPEIIRLLHAAYPDATCELNFSNAWELLVATVLSAQCTDQKVNQVTPALFARYPTPKALAEADIAEWRVAVGDTGAGLVDEQDVEVAGVGQLVAPEPPERHHRERDLRVEGGEGDLDAGLSLRGQVGAHGVDVGLAEHVAGREGIDIACAEGALRLLQVQRPGGKAISAADYLNARRDLKA